MHRTGANLQIIRFESKVIGVSTPRVDGPAENHGYSHVLLRPPLSRSRARLARNCDRC